MKKQLPYWVTSKHQVLPLRDIAQLYGYSQDYLRNLVNRKKLPALKKGKFWYIKVRDMQNYIPLYT
jgi:hypothetical protein